MSFIRNIIIFTCAVVVPILSANSQALAPRSISDLPPDIHSGDISVVDVFVESSRVDDTVLRVCEQFRATCAVVGESSLSVGYVCKGDAIICWRRFLGALRGSAITVLAHPAAGGGSFSFVLTGGGAVGGFSSEDAPDAPDAPNGDGAAGGDAAGATQ